MKAINYKLNDATLLLISTVLVNAGNYAINLLLGRFLGPVVFAEASIIATIVLVLSFIAVGLQLTAAKYTAEQDDKIDGFQNWFKSATIRRSALLSLFLLACTPWIKGFLNFSSIWPLVIIFIGIPVFFGMAVSRGFMQGSENFKSLAGTYLLEMIIRFCFTFGLVFIALNYFEFLVIESIAVSFFLSFFAAIFFEKKQRPTENKNFEKPKTLKRFILIVGVYELSQIIINNSDVIMVKHFFENTEAGLYAAIALIGRVIFFGTWTIVTLLFPKVIQREKEGKEHASLFWLSLLATGAFGFFVVACSYLFPEFIIQLLFGEAYLEVAPLLWKYGVATSFFALANVFAYYHMSLENYIPVFFSIVGGLLQIAGIVLFHENLMSVIWVQICVIGVLLISMCIYHLIYLNKNSNYNKTHLRLIAN